MKKYESQTRPTKLLFLRIIILITSYKNIYHDITILLHHIMYIG